MEETPLLQWPEELYSGGGMFVKVMTDEQMEILQKQIAVYSVISQQLLLLHKSSLTSQNDQLTAGARVGNLYYDPYLPSGSHKMSGRQRWSPTSTQLRILEEIFNQGTGTPNKQKIKAIAAKLSEHGQISETNVYNWFQNRRARFKRKQQAAPAKRAQTEASTELRSPSKTATNSGDLQHHGIGSSTRSESMYTTDGSSELGVGLDQISFSASDLPNSRLDCLGEKIHASDNSYPCWKEEGRYMAG